MQATTASTAEAAVAAAVRVANAGRQRNGQRKGRCRGPTATAAPTRKNNAHGVLNAQAVVACLVLLLAVGSEAVCTPPEIETVNPTSGTLGTRVVITGCGLASTSRVSLGPFDEADPYGVGAVKSVDSVNDTYIEVTADFVPEGLPPGAVIAYNSSNLTLASLPSVWTYAAPLDITFVFPTNRRGTIGTLVTIFGSFAPDNGGATSNDKVTLAGVDAQIVSDSSSRIVAAAGDPGGGATPSGPIVVTTDTGAFAEASGADFVYVAPGTITSIDPSSGQFGTRVTLQGTDFHGVLTGTAVSRVLVNGVASTDIVSENNTYVVFRVPEGATAGNPVEITVEANDGSQATNGTGFEKLVDGVVSAISPLAAGPGATVTITGTNLLGHTTGIATFTVVGVDALANITSSTATAIEFVVPDGGSGSGPVSIEMSNGAKVVSTIQFTYASIDTLDPNQGTGGTLITISGVGLDSGDGNVSSVRLGTTEASIVNVAANKSSVVVNAGARTAGLVDVTITSNAGNTVTKQDAFTYLTAPVITAVSPASGQVGTRVTITGTDLLGGGNSAAQVTLKGTAVASITGTGNNTVVEVVAAAATAGLGSVVLTSDTGATVSFANGFTYLTEGNVVSVTPASGQLGTRVTVAGTNLRGGGASVVSVTLVGNAATIASESNTQVVVVAPNAAAAQGNVVLVADTGATVTEVNGFEFLTLGNIVSIDPVSGTTGTRVTLTGTSLLGGGSSLVSATIGSVNATVVSGNDTTAVVAAGVQATALSNQAITVIADTGATVTGTPTFAFLQAGAVDTVSPNVGAHDTRVSINGTNLLAYGTALASVTLNGVEVKTITSANDSLVLVIADSAAGGTGDVVITANTGGRVSLVDGWTYVATPVINHVSPNVGVTGSEVLISGTNLFGGGSTVVSVTLAGVAASKPFAVNNNALLRVVAGTNPNPNGTTLGDVVVTSDNGATVTLTDGFTYQPDTSVLLVSPSSGQFGTVVTIIGRELQGNADSVTDVFLAGVRADITFQNDTKVVVVAAASPPKTGNVLLRLDTDAEFVEENAWEYIDQGTIFSVSPTSGQAGTVVTLTGQNLLGGGTGLSAAKLNNVSATVQSANNSIVILVAQAAASAGSGDIELTSNTGAEVTRINGWSYVVPPAITSVAPSVGQHGTRVTINGTNLLGGGSAVASVTLASVDVLEVVSESNTQIVVRAGDNGGSSTAASPVRVVADSGAFVQESGTGKAFAYQDVGSVIAASPNNGQGGVEVVVSGTDLLGGGSSIASVKLKGIEALSISPGGSDTLVTLRAGINNNITGAGSIVVESDTGAITQSATGWTYVATGVVDQVQPSQGQEGTSVTITGTSLLAGGSAITSVTLAGTAAASVDSANDTVIVVTAANASAGVGDVVILADNKGVITTADAWTYLAEGSIASFNPTSGIEGTIVTIAGTALRGGGLAVVTAKFGSADATVTSESDTQVVAAVGNASTTGAVNVILTSDSGARVTGTPQWTFASPPVITAVDPAEGQVGTLITITGTTLLGYGSTIASATVGSTAASVVSSNDTVVVLRAASAADATGLTITLVADTGAIIRAQNAWEYLVEGNVSAIDPASGHGGTLVTITGTNLLGGGTTISSVTLAGVAVTSVQPGFTSQSIVVTAAPNTGSASGPAVIQTDTGATVTGGAFAYVAAGTIATVEPDRGQLGTIVVISGTGLLAGATNVTTVTLNGVAVEEIVSFNETEVRVIAAAGSPAPAGDVIIEVDSGATITKASAFTYDTASAISNVSPTSGQVGTRVTITGTLLFGQTGGSAAETVTLSGVQATVVSQSASSIVVSAAAASAGAAGDVVVTADTGARAVAASAFAYITAGEITSIDPNVGQVGTLVSINGTALLGGGSAVASVVLAGTAASSITSASNSQVVVVAGDGGSANGTVIITADTGAQVTSTLTFAYSNGSQINAVDPQTGEEGTRVTITGTQLRAGGPAVQSVTLAGFAASIESESDTTVVVRAGENTNGSALTGDVRVVSSTGAVTAVPNAFSYRSPGTIASVVPSSGQVGTRVELQGTGLLGGGSALDTATLGGENATISSANDTDVVLVAGQNPAGQSASIIGDVKLISDTGAIVSKASGWTYLVQGSIAAVDPAQGQGGTTVVLGGTNLCGAGATSAQSITLGGIQVASIQQSSCALITVVAGDSTNNASVVGDIVITGNTGATVTATDAWTYIVAANIVAVQPAAGQAGDVITVTGGSLLGGGTTIDTATLSGVPAIVDSANSTVVVLIAGKGPLSFNQAQGDVVLTSDTGVVVTETDAWTYSVIQAINPSSGQAGTRVTATGIGLRAGGSAVVSARIVGVAASIVSENDTVVIIDAGANAISQDQTGLVRLVADNAQEVVSQAGHLDQLLAEFTYKVPGAISTVDPARGQAGTLVTITGTQLLGYGSSLSAVTLSGVAVASIVSQNDTTVVVRASTSSAGAAGAVVLTANTGAVVSRAAAFEYVAEGTITSVSPASGREGTRVTINGTELLGGASSLADVVLAGVSAGSITSASASRVVVVAAAGSAGVGDVELVSSNGAQVTLSNGFEYVAAGTISSVSPSSGQGGTRVVIQGTELLGGGSSIVEVLLVDTAVTQIVSENNTVVEVVAAAKGSAGAGSVKLVADTGALITQANAFTYLTAGSVTQVVPDSGQFGTVVTVSGSNLLGGGSSLASVTLGGTAATSITSASNTEVVVVADSASASTGGDVVLTADTGAVTTGSGLWTQLEDGAIASLTPSSGQTGTTVTIAGQRLLGGGSSLASVTLAGVAATINPGSVSATEVVVTVGSGGTAGVTGNVTLVADTGATVTQANAFTYVQAGTIVSVSPSSGQNGTVVTITGTSLLVSGTQIVSVQLASVEVLSIVSSNDTRVVVVADGSGSAVAGGSVVLVSDTGAVTTLTNAWEYVAPGSVTLVSPASGQVGTVVTITGTGLRSGGSSVASVTLAGTTASQVQSESETQVVVQAASAAAGTGDVVLIADTGARVVGAGLWEYLEAGVVSSVVPSSGQTGSSVAISGQRLLGGGTSVTSVTLAGVAAQVVSSTNTLVTVTAAGSSSATTGDVVLVANTGATVTEVNGWAYLTPGNITLVSPAFGQEGTRVVIDGTRLFADGADITSVTLAGVAATVTGKSDTQVNVTAASSVAKTGDVVVTSDTGITVTKINGFEYRAAGAVVAVEPASAVTGATVRIFGSNLLGHGSSVVSVTLAGISSSVQSAQNFAVRVTAGTAASTSGSVVIVADTGAVVSGATFTYLAAPNITTVHPASGSVGTVVTISGTSLLGGSTIDQVLLKGTAAALQSANNTDIVVAVGNGALGVGDVVLVLDSGATITKENAFEYVALGDIHAVVPSKGQFGTVVTISGTSLLGGGSAIRSVTLGGVAQSLVSANDTIVVVKVVTDESAAIGNVEIQTNVGTSISRVNGWRYLAKNDIANVQPATGQVGTFVTITGVRLLGGGSSIASVTLAGVAAQDIASANNTHVVARAGPEGGLTTGDVVLVADTGAEATETGAWTYVTASNITAVAPSQGHGGTLVTITGTDLLGGGSTIASVSLAGTVTTDIRSQSNTQVIAAAAASTTGVTGHVVVTSDTGATATRDGAWTYVAPGEIATVSPARGQEGTRVTITGTGLLGGGSSVAEVRLASLVATSASGNDTVVSVVAAAGAAGTGDVTIVSDTGATVTKTNGWTQLAAGNITAVSPSSGQEGTRVTLTGTSLLGGGSSLASASLAGVTASVESASSTQVVLEAATSVAGSGDVVLQADTGATVTQVGGWTYTTPGAIVSVTPSSGQRGTVVDIVGSNLRGAGSAVVSVTLSGQEVASITSETNTAVRVAAAAAAASGSGSVVLTADTGARVTGSTWTYLVEGNITVVDPAAGQQGTSVTIKGERLLGGGSAVASVTLAGVAATSVVRQNTTEVVVLAGASSPQTGDVVIVADTGAIVSKADAFTYAAAGTITSVTPSVGQLGTLVTLVGTGLLGGGSTVSSVQLSGVTAERVVQQSNSLVVVAAGGAGSFGTTGDAVVTSNSGAVVTLADSFTYSNPSAITSVVPSSGQVGTLVTVTGERLLGEFNGTSVVTVTLAGVAGTVVNGTSSTTVVVRANASGPVTGGDVVLVADTGARAVSAGAWTYLTEGSIAAVVPTAGQVGTFVNVTGSRLLGGGSSVASVTLAGVEATVLSGASDTLVRVRAGDGTPVVNGDVVVTADTGAVVTATAAWSYLATGSIVSAVPSSGQVGTRVTITGTSLRGHGTAVASVSLAGVSATVQNETDTRVLATAAASTSGTGDIVLESDTGALVTLANGWTYATAGTIASVSPASGQVGTLVTISGLSLLGQGSSIAEATLVGVTGTVQAQNNTQVVVEAGQGPASQQLGDVVLVADTGAVVTSTGAFTYLTPGSIVQVNPSSGRKGSVVDISGQLCGGGSSVESVSLAGLAANITSATCTNVRVVANDFGANVTGDVVVTSNTGARVTGENLWTYIAEGAITSVDPSAGPAGTTVVINGTGLFGGSTGVGSVTLAGRPALVISSSDTTVTVLSTSANGAVQGDVVVTGQSGVVVRLVNGWTYSTISSLSPTSGQRGTVVTISGFALFAGGSDVTDVEFAGVPVDQIVNASQTEVVVVIAPLALQGPRLGDVQITADNGQTVTASDAWTYQTAGSIDVVAPASGHEGTRVTISGDNLLGHGSALVSVTLVGVAAQIESANNTRVVVVAVASSAGSGDIVLTADTGATVVLFDGNAKNSLPGGKWTYVTPASIATVAPSTGQVGTRVTVTGTGLLGGGTAIASVLLDGVAASAVLTSSGTTVVVTAADGNATGSAGDVTLIADTGATVTSAGSWQYLARGVVADVDPSSGQLGTNVTITGTSLRGHGAAVSQVALAGVTATVVSESDTSVVVVAGASGSAGSGDVVLTADTGATVTLVGGWAYVTAGDVVAVSPSSGQGGTLVTINGTNLLGGGAAVDRVVLAGQTATSVSSFSDTSVVVVAAASGSAQTGDVVVVADTGATVTEPNGWQYVAPGSISALSPSSGQVGTRVNVTGTGLLNGGNSIASASFGSVSVTLDGPGSDTLVQVTVGSGGTGGVPEDVTLVADTGATVTSANAWTPVTAGVISGLTPSSGQFGTRVNITGTGMLGGGSAIAAVTLAGVAVDSVVPGGSDTLVSVVAGTSNVSAVGDVVLTADTGATVTLSNGWTYLAPGEIVLVTPSEGQFGTRVAISGTRLLGGGARAVSVRLSGVEAQLIESSSDTLVEAVAADGPVGPGDVVIESETGSKVTAPYIHC